MLSGEAQSTAPAGGPFVLATFTTEAPIDLSAYLPEIGNFGFILGAWSVVGGNASLTAGVNALFLSFGPSANMFVNSIINTSNGNWRGLLVRGLDEDNYINIRIFTSQIFIEIIVDGSQTVLLSEAKALGADNEIAVDAVTIGSQLTVTIAGDVVYDEAVEDLVGNTGVGFWGGQQNLAKMSFLRAEVM